MFCLQEGNEQCCKDSVMRDHDPEEHTKCSGHMHLPAESTKHFLTSETGSHVRKLSIYLYISVYVCAALL